MKELERESDRGCALAAASYLDDKLRQLLQARMVQHSAVDDLLENPDGLRTFSVRTNLAFVLGIISREVFSDLNRIRDIRNSFGHILELRRFTHPTVVHVCNSLENMLEDLLLKRRRLSAPRTRFVKSVMAIETIFECSLAQSKRPGANRKTELESLDYWKDLLTNL